MSFTRGVVAFFSNVPESRLMLDTVARSRFIALKSTFEKVADETNIPWYLLAAIAWNESNFNASAVNPNSGASGLMQIMPFHFSRFDLGANGWADPLKNIRAGAQIIIDSGYKTKSLVDTFAAYGGFTTWLRTGKAEKDGKYVAALDPRPYVNNFIARGTYLALTDTTGEL